MWFPDGVWRTITGFLFPIWGRNPWLKKYSQVLAFLPNVVRGQQPSTLSVSYPALRDGGYRFTIQLYYLNWGWNCVQRTRPFGYRWIKIYTLDIVYGAVAKTERREG